MYRFFPDCMVELAGKYCAYGSVHTMITCPPNSFVLFHMTGYFFDVVHCRYCFSLELFLFCISDIFCFQMQVHPLGTSQILKPELLMDDNTQLTSCLFDSPAWLDCWIVANARVTASRFGRSLFCQNEWCRLCSCSGLTNICYDDQSELLSQCKLVEKVQAQYWSSTAIAAIDWASRHPVWKDSQLMFATCTCAIWCVN